MQSAVAAARSPASLVESLMRPGAFPHAADDLHLEETHISWVVAAGPYAYKIKKPVDFGFLDFTTPERRAADCAAEVRLNRRLCPDLYLGVVNVVEWAGGYSVRGFGRPVESAVWMRRLPRDGMLPTLLARGQVDTPLVEEIARQLARFHESVLTGGNVSGHGSLTAVRRNWAENFQQTRPYRGRSLSPEIGDDVQRYVSRFLRRNGDLIGQRVATGRIRDGHGDLHAGSVCVADGRVYLFDCLEFCDRFRCADVAAEVAFLAMDLDQHGRPDLSAAFCAAYVAHSRDDDLWRLLDFYKCYRAFVRGKVLSFRLDEPALSSDAATRAAADARAYLELAWRYADS